MWHCVVCGGRLTGKMSHQGPSNQLIPHSLKIFNDVTLDMLRLMHVINPKHHFLKCNVMMSLVMSPAMNAP